MTKPRTSNRFGCEYCDFPGGAKTYANQVALPIGRRVYGIDWCIHRIVAALNASGIRTVASCCGHGYMPGDIELDDGRVLVLYGTRGHVPADTFSGWTDHIDSGATE